MNINLSVLSIRLFTVALLSIILMSVTSNANSQKYERELAIAEAQRRIHVLSNKDQIKNFIQKGSESALSELNSEPDEKYRLKFEKIKKELISHMISFKKIDEEWNKHFEARLKNSTNCSRFMESVIWINRDIISTTSDVLKWSTERHQTQLILLQARFLYLRATIALQSELIRLKAEGGQGVLEEKTLCFDEESRQSVYKLSQLQNQNINHLTTFLYGEEGLENLGRFNQNFQTNKFKLNKFQNYGKTLHLSLFFGGSILGGVIINASVKNIVMISLGGSSRVAFWTNLAAQAAFTSATTIPTAIEIARSLRTQNSENSFSFFIQTPMILGESVFYMNLNIVKEQLEAEFKQRSDLFKVISTDLENLFSWSNKYGGTIQAIEHLQKRIYILQQQQE